MEYTQTGVQRTKESGNRRNYGWAGHSKIYKSAENKVVWACDMKVSRRDDKKSYRRKTKGVGGPDLCRCEEDGGSEVVASSQK